MVIVKPKGRENFESMLRRFKRKVEQSEVLAELYYRQYFRKPSLQRKEPKPKKWKKR